MKSTDACVADIISIMEQLAPPALAEEWDNCGLQVGSPRWSVKKAWVALDPLLTVIEGAIDQGVDMVITHHPLVFQPLTKIDLETDVGRIIGKAIEGRVAIFVAHTNLDSALEGVNDELAKKVGVYDLEPLVAANEPFPDAYSDDSILTPGLGRIGVLPAPVTVAVLAEKIKNSLGIQHVTIAGNPNLNVEKAALCSGSGAGLLEVFLGTDAQVYVSGDLKYHQAREVEAAGRALIDVGHFASEHIIIDALAGKLERAVKDAGWPLIVEACQLERDPFIQI